MLGARLDFSALLDQPDLLLVTAALILLNLVIHALAALATRQPLSAGLIATAQLGVPAAVVQIGLQEHAITPALGAATRSFRVCCERYSTRTSRLRSWSASAVTT